MAAAAQAKAPKVDDTIAELLPISRLHTASDESADTWSHLNQAGVFGICLGEEAGGSGLGVAEEALIAIGLGRRLASPSVLATLGAVHGGASDLAGRRVAAAYRSGGRIVVVQSPGAELLLLRSADEATLHAFDGAQPQALENRLWLADLGVLDHVGEPLARFDQKALLRLRLLLQLLLLLEVAHRLLSSALLLALPTLAAAQAFAARLQTRAA